METIIGNQHTKKIFFDGISKECVKCNEIKPLTYFHKDNNKYLTAYYCKECANKNSRKYHKARRDLDPLYRESKRDGWIKNAYGISLNEYKEKLKLQGSRCSICEINLLDAGTLTHLDHDHKTGKLRDFLCTNCNRGLGHFKDNPNLLSKAIQYLNKHSEEDK